MSAPSNLGLAGILATWNFGNDVLAEHRGGRALRARAGAPVAAGSSSPIWPRKYFPGVPNGDGVARAVAQFSQAMEYYPFDMPLIYLGPDNYAAAYPLTPGAADRQIDGLVMDDARARRFPARRTSSSPSRRSSI